MRKSIKNQETNLLPLRSLLHIIGQLTKKDDGKVTATYD